MARNKGGRSSSRTGRMASALVALVFLLAARDAQAIGWSDAQHFGESAFDLIVLRPFGAMAMAAGSVFFVASVPLVAPYPAIKDGSIEGIRGAYSMFFYPPYEYTVVREIGDF